MIKRELAAEAAVKTDQLVAAMEKLANLSDAEIWSGERLAVIDRIYKVRETAEFLKEFSA
jgi:hypothetical protein